MCNNVLWWQRWYWATLYEQFFLAEQPVWVCNSKWPRDSIVNENGYAPSGGQFSELTSLHDHLSPSVIHNIMIYGRYDASQLDTKHMGWTPQDHLQVICILLPQNIQSLHKRILISSNNNVDTIILYSVFWIWLTKERIVPQVSICHSRVQVLHKIHYTFLLTIITPE